jgi:uncharacterized protein YceK
MVILKRSNRRRLEMKTVLLVVLVVVLAGCPVVTQHDNPNPPEPKLIVPSDLDSDGEQGPAAGQKRYLWIGNAGCQTLEVRTRIFRTKEETKTTLPAGKAKLIWFPVEEFTELDFHCGEEVVWGLEFVLHKDGPRERISTPKGTTVIHGRYLYIP